MSKQSVWIIGVGRGGWVGGGAGGHAPSNFGGGANIPFAPPPTNNPPTLSFNVYVKQ